jgi:hypothetical protein
VNGTGEALSWTSYASAAASREIFPGGSTGSFGITVRQQSGKLTEDDDDTFWNLSQRSRWTAEDVVSRAKSVLGAAAANSVQHAQALVWAGYSNRHLGENFCQGVINGGAPQAHTIYFDRAEANFTEALTVATAANTTALVQAATAGRASVRLYKGNFAAAATDASAITNNASRTRCRTDRTGSVQSSTRASHIAHRLEHAEQGLSQGDARSARSVRLEAPRCSWATPGGEPPGACGASDQVPDRTGINWPPAEARLSGRSEIVGGDVTGAMAIINALARGSTSRRAPPPTRRKRGPCSSASAVSSSGSRGGAWVTSVAGRPRAALGRWTRSKNSPGVTSALPLRCRRSRPTRTSSPEQAMVGGQSPVHPPFR